jgi:glycosyltransferase involved in cell wall biosynthesis
MGVSEASGQVVDSAAAARPAGGEGLWLSVGQDGDRPRGTTGGRAAGVALRHLKRVVPRPLRPRLGRSEDHYRPRPLTVPVGYPRARPPDPAPTISIVTPTWNRSPYLARTLESVIGQRYPSLEYIVIHDGSSEVTAEILDGYREELRQIESRPDRRQASAINDGFARSSGEIMAWLNSDDVLMPGALAHVAGYFAAHPEVDVVYGHCILLDPDDRDVGLWVTPRHCADSLRWFDFMPQETVFWRRRVWDSVGEIDESLTLAFDWDLFCRFHRSGARIVRLPRFLGGFRQHPEQRTRVEQEKGLLEQARIRQRWHGRPVGSDELRARAFPYMLRSLPYFARYRALAKLRARRVAVSFSPGQAQMSEET